MTQKIDEAGSLSSTLPVPPRPVSMGSVHLNALRGAAALLVFVSHTRALYFTSVLEPSLIQAAALPSAAEWHRASTPKDAGPIEGMLRVPDAVAGSGVKLASEAVVIFFVLSGYLVGGSVLRALRLERWSWRDYLIKRLTRLWVPLIPCLLICLCLDRTGYRLFGMGSIYHDVPGIDLRTSWDIVHRMGARVFLGNIFFLQGILVPVLGTDVSLWSLANEFWYYLAFPCALLTFAKGRTFLFRILYGFLAIAFLIFAGKQIAALYPIWLLGAAVAALPDTISQRAARLMSLVVLLLLLVCMLEVRFVTMDTVLTEYFIALVTSGFLYLLVQQKKMARDTIYRRVATYFSEISYTLYVVHLPIAIFLASWINSPWHQWKKTPGNLVLFLLLDGVVLACATVLWKFFEANTDRIRRILFERANSSKRQTVGM